MRRTFEHASIRLISTGEIDLVLDFTTPLGRQRRQTYRFADRGRYKDFCFELGVAVQEGQRRANKRAKARAEWHDNKVKSARKRATAA